MPDGQRRDKFIDWLVAREYGDGSSPLKWAEVQYADDEGESIVTRHSDEPNGSEARPYR